MKDSRHDNAMAAAGRRIYGQIGEALFRYWDPIEVNTYAPNDEYDAYIGPVYRVLASGGSDLELAELLSRLEREEMGLNGNGSLDQFLPVVAELRRIPLRFGS